MSTTTTNYNEMISRLASLSVCTDDECYDCEYCNLIMDVAYSWWSEICDRGISTGDAYAWLHEQAIQTDAKTRIRRIWRELVRG